MHQTRSKRLIISGVLLTLGLVISLLSSIPNNTALALPSDEWVVYDCYPEPDTEGIGTTGFILKCYARDVQSVPDLLPDRDVRRALEEKSGPKWQELIEKYPYFECLPEGNDYNCYSLDKNGEAKKQVCEYIGSALCAGLAASICAPESAAVPLLVGLSAACAKLAYDVCKKEIVDTTCKDVGKSQRKLIATFPREP